MSHFVDVCRKEWKRRGVPDAVANEMASDLDADLAEAQQDGASPEEVLGNGYLDARAFAASWADARGIVMSPGTRIPKTIQVRTLAFALSAAASAFVAAVGLLVFMGPRIGSSSSVAIAFRRSLHRPLHAILVSPQQHFAIGPSGALRPLGLIVLVAGLIGIGITLWLWKPGSSRHDVDPPELGGPVGLRTYI